MTEARVFISYARSDPGDFLELVRSFLADQGFEIWLDVRTMPNRAGLFRTRYAGPSRTRIALSSFSGRALPRRNMSKPSGARCL